MEPADRLATVALAVSLVALIVAFLQLLAQFFGTAEGYRRCGEAIIGPWHQLRWRHWLWTEFRYETNFVTPNIWLVSPHSRSRGRSFTFDDILCYKGSLSPDHRGLLSWDTHQDESHDAKRVLKSTICPESDLQRLGTKVATEACSAPPNNSHSRLHGHHNPKRHLHRGTIFRAKGTRHASPNENTASWLALLRELNGVYGSYPSRRQNKSGLVIDALSSRDDISRRIKSPSDSSAMSLEHSEVTISLSSYSWDAMPMDVPRPLSRTQLGDLVILAMRMGMVWQSLDISSGRLLAAGNGFSLSFIEVQSLGWVARLNETASHLEYPSIAPGRAAEKLMCGIIPGCRRFVDKDIRCISKDGDLNVFKALCRNLPMEEFAETVKSKIEKRDFPILDRAFDNDVLVLLCEFLAVPNSAACGHYSWLWKWAPRAASFHHWEARYALRKHLLTAKQAGQLSCTLSNVLDYFTHLEVIYRADFYALSEFSVFCDTSETGKQKMSDLLNDCQLIFEWTSQWLLSHGYDQRVHSESSDYGGHSRYVYLVIAYWKMSYNAVRSAKANAQSRHQGKHDRSNTHEAYSLNDIPVAYKWFHTRTFELMNACIEALRNNELVDYMSSKGISDDEGHFNEAWWVLLLRGHVWDLATQELTPREETHIGSPIPSMYYNDATPIWIS